MRIDSRRDLLTSLIDRTPSRPAKFMPAGRIAEKLGFSAYAIARDQDDPLAKAIHGLLDHAAETDRRLASLIGELVAQGIKCDEEVQVADHFDPKYLSKIVD